MQKNAFFYELSTLQTFIVEFYKYWFLQTWHIRFASLVLGRCLLADHICVWELGLLKNCKQRVEQSFVVFLWDNLIALISYLWFRSWYKKCKNTRLDVLQKIWLSDRDEILISWHCLLETTPSFDGKVDWIVKFNLLVFPSMNHLALLHQSSVKQTLKKQMNHFLYAYNFQECSSQEEVIKLSARWTCKSGWQENWKGWIHPWQPVQTWQAHNHVSICCHLPASVAWRWK